MRRRALMDFRNDESFANGVSLDISGIVESYPDYGKWDTLNNWYHTHYLSSGNIAVSNGLLVNKLYSKPIKGECYLRGFAPSGGQYAINNSIRFYGCNNEKALEETGNPCTQCSKTFQYTPIDQLPDGSEGAGVIVIYPQEEYAYYYVQMDAGFYSGGNVNAKNSTWIAAFNSTVLDNPLMELSAFNGEIKG